MLLRILIGILIGAIIGFAYNRLIGCSSGACPLTSNYILSTIYGAIIGGLVALINH
jgi:gas vesicle protein